jgi:hypothetical protein
MKRCPIAVVDVPEREEDLKKVMEKFEDLMDIGFVQLKSAVQSCPVVLVKMKVETIQVWNAPVHTLNYFVLELKKSRAVKWDPDVAREGGGHIVTHRTETELKFVRLSEN